MPKLRVHNFSVSVDGYAAGPDQSLDNPLGVRGEELHNWLVATRTFRKMFGEEGGGTNLDEAPNGYEIAEFVGTPAALHVRFVRKA